MNTTAAAAPAARRRFFVTKAGLGRVTVTLTREECDLYIAGAEANGGTGYEVNAEPFLTVTA